MYFRSGLGCSISTSNISVPGAVFPRAPVGPAGEHLYISESGECVVLAQVISRLFLDKYRSRVYFFVVAVCTVWLSVRA